MTNHVARQLALLSALTAFALVSPAAGAAPQEAASDEWIALFDGRSLDGWRAAEHPETWRVEDGCLVARGARSHLFYAGPVGNADFRNFELVAEVRTEPLANSGIYFHTQYQETGWPEKGYEVQINNTVSGAGNYRELNRTGSLYGVRNIYRSNVQDGPWFRVRIRVVANRIQVWINDDPTVDYLEPENPVRKPRDAQRVLSRGTFALQGHDPGSVVAFRRIAVRILPEDADPQRADRPTTDGYGVDPDQIDRLAGDDIPVIDYHIHLRGGMTVEKSLERQMATGVNLGVLENLGEGWPLDTDERLREFLDGAKNRPLFVGVQVNDRDWHLKHAPELLKRLDYVLGDTMIMPMPADDSPPVKLWIADQYKIDDPEAWMDRYVRHNLRVLAEPITILANPTYLPPAVKDQYDRLWTDERMKQVIQAAIDNGVALEINAASGLPSDRFLRMAKQMGAKFTFGTNNFDDRRFDLSRYFDAIQRYGLTKDDMYVPVSAANCHSPRKGD
jgi:hypothetical protein